MIFREKMHRVSLLFFAVALAALTTAQGAALAQSSQTGQLLQRLDRLEQDLQDLQRSYYRGEKPRKPRSGPASSSAPMSGPRLAEAEVRMSQLESQMRQLTGRIEEVQHKIDRVRDRLDKLVADVDFRLNQIESRLRGDGPPLAAQNGRPPQDQALSRRQPSSAGPQSRIARSMTAAPGAPPKPATGGAQSASTRRAPALLPAGSAADRYNFAFSLLRKADFARAEQAFQEFIQLHGEDRLAGNAYYWLGETYYSRGKLQDAARVFLTGFEKFPDGVKAPDSLLKLAITLSRMNQRDEACSTLGELKKRFVTLGRSIAKRHGLEWRKNKCG